MIKSRKLLTVASLILGVSMLVACGSKQVTDNNDEDLTQPQYETQSMPDNIKVLEDGVKVVEINGRKYRELEFFISGKGYKYLYLPYIPESEKMQGVLYSEDVYVTTNFLAHMGRFNEMNKPEGTSNAEVGGSGLLTHSSLPVYGDVTEMEYNPLSDSAELLSVGTDDSGQMKIDKYDVRAISFALYEKYYEKVPNITIKVYGLSTELWERNVGVDKDFDLKKWSEYSRECEQCNFTNCILLSEKKVGTTGVYYIDFKELSKKGNYMQYFLVAEFDEAMEYTYFVDGAGMYNINDESAYIEWKKQHADQFIAGY